MVGIKKSEIILKNICIVLFFVLSLLYTKGKDMTTIEKNNAAEIICLDILNKSILAIENKLNNKSVLKSEVKYYNSELNNYLSTEFKTITGIIQSVVDEFYIGHYIVDSFMPLHIEDLNHCVNHNLGLIRSMKKLIKFCQF